MFGTRGSSLLLAAIWLPLLNAASSEYEPHNLTVSERNITNDVCVTLRWSPPIGLSTIFSYEVNYNNTGWQPVGTNLSSEKCGLSPCQLLPYELRVKDGAKSISGEYRISCSEPQSGPRSVDLTADSTSCVTLSWEPPDNPDIPVIFYQYLLEFPHNSVNISTPERNRHQICGFSPNQMIYIRIRAVNSYGNGPWTKSPTIETLYSDVQLGLLSVNQTVHDSSCVNLTWELREESLNITGYQYKCNEEINWTNVTNSTGESLQLCEFASYQRVQCSMRAVTVDGFSNVTTPHETRTQCSAPSWPPDVKSDNSTSTQVLVNGKLKWKYTVKWQEPTSVNCKSVADYITWFPTKEAHNKMVSPSLERVVHADGDLLQILYIVVRNSEGYETPVYEVDLKTPVIDPGNVTVKSVNLAADNSTCATLAWGFPDFPNSTDAGYQYRCRGDATWLNVSTSGSHLQICEFSHYQLVQCEMRAFRDGNYTEGTKSPQIRIPCEASSTLRELSLGQPVMVSNNNRLRWRYILTWKAPVDINCANILYYDTVLHQGSRTTLLPVMPTTTRYVVYADGSDPFNYIMSAVNNQKQESLYVEAKTLSPILAPQHGPYKLKLKEKGTDCLELTWNAPSFPNTFPYDLHYHYKCDVVLTDWNNVTAREASALKLRVCSVGPYKEIQCRIRACNSAGCSLIHTANFTRVGCPAPSLPRSVDFGRPSMEMNSGALRWKYRVSWKEPLIPNCGGILEYRTRYPNDRSPFEVVSSGTSRDVYAEPEKVISFTIFARNKKHIDSQPVSAIITAPAISQQAKPLYVNLTSNSSSCVTLSWQKPEYHNTTVTNYQLKCSHTANWSSMSVEQVESGSQQICDLSTYQPISCEMRASTNRGYDISAVSPTIHTLCTAPTAPTNLTVSQNVTKELNSGRMRWKFTASWQEPDNINCESITSYIVQWDGDNSTVVPGANGSRTTQEVYLDGAESQKYLVSAINNAGMDSESSRLSIDSDPLRPQLGPRNVSLTVDNSTCGTLSWQPPEYPNVQNTTMAYQINCGNSVNWTDIPDSNTSTTQICDFHLDQNASCTIQAVNSAGASDVSTSNIALFTCKAPPTFPDDIAGYVTEDAYRSDPSEPFHRRQIKINIAIKDISSECEVVNLTIFRVEGGKYNISSNQLIEDLDAVTNYTISYKAVNNHSMETVKTFTVTTGELEPGPVQVCVTPLNTSCALLSWSSPTLPNGKIVYYQHRCSVNGQTAKVVKQPQSGVRTFQSCGYQPIDNVTCSVQAATVIGKGPYSDNSTRIPCDKPASLKLTVTNTASGGDHGTISLKISWQAAKANCDYIAKYIVTVQSEEGVQSNFSLAGNQTRESTVDGLNAYTYYTVRVTAINNEDLKNITQKKWLTMETKPSDAPSLQLHINGSCVSLNISSPLRPNGVILSYKYDCVAAGQFEDGQIGRSNAAIVQASDLAQGIVPTVCNLMLATKITCQSTAVNSVGESPSAIVSVFSPIEVITPDQNISVQSNSTSDMASIVLKPVQLTNTKSKISKYRLVVSEGNSQIRIKRSANDKSCNSSQLYNSSVATELGLPCYITAEINRSAVREEGLTFDLGDGRTVGGYYNAPLQSDTEYSLTVGIVINLKTGDTLSKYFQPRSFTSPTKTITPTTPVPGGKVQPTTSSVPGGKEHVKSCPAGCVAGIITGVLILCVVIVLAVLAYLYRRRKRNRSNSTSSNYRLISMDTSTSTVSLANVTPNTQNS